MDSFFVKVNEKQRGPISVRDLKNLVTGHSSRDDVLVWDDALADWVSPRRLTEIQSLAAFPTKKLSAGRRGQLIAIAGGKGGVGKSVISTSLGVGLASMGNQVVLVDGDLAGPDLHTCMGILDPKYTFFDFYTLAKDDLADIVLETPVQNLGLISGACGTLGVANPKYFQKQRFIRGLKSLDSDYVILDLGAGASYNVVDFFLLGEERIIVTTPEPTALNEAFGFLKICVMRELTRRFKKWPQALAIVTQDCMNRPGKTELTMKELLKQLEHVDSASFQLAQDFLQSFRPKLVVNMVKSRSDLKEGMAVQAAAMELLSVNLNYLGYISYDSNVGESVRARKPFLLHNPKSKASQDLSGLIRFNLLGKKGVREMREKRAWRKQIVEQSKEFQTADLTENAPHLFG